MAIMRIERAVYAVDDLPACTRFFEDFGLALTDSGPVHSVLTTQMNQQVELRLLDDPAMPSGLEDGPTLREIVWGVDSPESLAALAADLRRDRLVAESLDGTLHTRDETGFGLGLRVADPQPVGPPLEGANTYGKVDRWNEPRSEPEPVHPLRICHVAWNVPKDGFREAVDFYVDRLNFRIIDDVLPMGTFMQCEGDDDQHNLLLCHRPDRAGVNHTSYEVRTFDEVILGGNHMVEQGWQEARRLGRHTVGSNLFRFVHAPCGGRVEYAADMDRVDASYETRVHQTTPPHHLWTLRTNKDGE